MIPRIHLAVAAPLRPGDTLELPPEQSRHVAQALRMRVGDALTIFSGTGGEYEATIERIERRDVVVH
ncbi:MAG TPA: RNA methyltransferase PUA domain-containing protein, partial [Casimicrobiaceae bacterium]|nr:RNA methyltransferase PUA domain-containing protein [Casimicrobiaceae bacterium]